MEGAVEANDALASVEDVLEFWFGGDLDVSPQWASDCCTFFSTCSSRMLERSALSIINSHRRRLRPHHTNACSLTFPPPHTFHQYHTVVHLVLLQDNYKRKWFPASDKTGQWQRRMDDEITARFSTTLRAAEDGRLDSWRGLSPSSAVALVVTLDQFARHIYRHHPDRDAKVAASDAAAVAVTERCLAGPCMSPPFHLNFISLCPAPPCSHSSYPIPLRSHRDTKLVLKLKRGLVYK